MTAKVIKLRKKNRVKLYPTDIDDPALLWDYLNREIAFMGGIIKGLESVCDEHNLCSEFEAGGVFQLAYVHLDRLTKIRELIGPSSEE
jgi:hypothetical protein